FSTRFSALRRLVQETLNRLPSEATFLARVPVRLRLTLDDLALVLPPSERRLLDHLRARKPLRALVGTPGFHTVRRLNERLQRLLWRVRAYCGAHLGHQLMQPYDRPGHLHRRRPGRPRRLPPCDNQRGLLVWMPRWFAAEKGYAVRWRPDTSRDETRRLLRG